MSSERSSIPLPPLVGVLLLSLSILLQACSAEGDRGPAEEAEEPIVAPGQEEQVSLGELRADVERRAEEGGFGPAVVECVVDYLAENFDDEVSSDEALEAVDEGFGACTVTSLPPGAGTDPPG